jgi:hypothetical protein
VEQQMRCLNSLFLVQQRQLLLQELGLQLQVSKLL